VLDLTVWRAAAIEQAATFIAIAAGLGVLGAVGHARGWSEVTDLVDGLVYGVSAGLGFAAGETLVRWISATPSVGLALLAPASDAFWRASLAGLANGVFGGIIGAGFGFSVGARSRVAGALAIVTATGIAVLVCAGHHILAVGNALGGSAGLARAWTALLLPATGLVAVAVYGLAVERRAIGAFLVDEVAQGTMTQADLDLLRSVLLRQHAYGRAIARLRFRRFRRLAALHNRQVMLALTKRREARARDEAHRARLRKEVGVLRSHIVDLREQIE
jgi:hypothetical protein